MHDASTRNEEIKIPARNNLTRNEDGVLHCRMEQERPQRNGKSHSFSVRVAFWAASHRVGDNMIFYLVYYANPITTEAEEGKCTEAQILRQFVL